MLAWEIGRGEAISLLRENLLERDPLGSWPTFININNLKYEAKVFRTVVGMRRD